MLTAVPEGDYHAVLPLRSGGVEPFENPGSSINSILTENETQETRRRKHKPEEIPRCQQKDT